MQTELLEEVEIGGVEVGAVLLEEAELLGEKGDVSKLCRKARLALWTGAIRGGACYSGGDVLVICSSSHLYAVRDSFFSGVRLVNA